MADPINGCSSLANAEELKHRIAVIERGECMFIDKVRREKNQQSDPFIVLTLSLLTVLSPKPIHFPKLQP